MENKKTALNSLHKKYGAKLVSFAGYEMPIQYSKELLKNIKVQEKMQVFLMYLIWVSYLLKE